MKLIFDRAGKYMNNFHIMEVTEKHVEDKAVFEVDESNGSDYVRVKKAHVFKEPEPETFETDIDKMTVDELKNYADEENIDLREATKKADILEAIKTAETDPDTGDGIND